MSDREEMLPLVDISGAQIGKTLRTECHQGPGRLHPVVHLHVINPAGEIYLQKRAAHKDVFPGYWDTAVGGHIADGETPDEALRREAGEEIGLYDFVPAIVATHMIETAFESEYTYVFMTIYDGPFHLNPAEVADGRFWTKPEIEANLGTGTFTPNFEQDFMHIIRWHVD